MTSVGEPMRHSPFDGDRLNAGSNKDLPLIPSATTPLGHSPPDPMDLSPHASQYRDQQASSGSPPSDRQHNPDKDMSVNGNSGGPVGAAAAAQQPKVVQTAFIHKLYSMLEDQTIQHLISWSNTNESFVMSPSTEFSKVLASYFKHTNISSFVRQLNMYGFHKVSDVFHTGSPDSPLWEFKHGAGSFKRGDLVGLREIKRRASRHTLINRDSFSNPQPHLHAPPPPPPTKIPTQHVIPQPPPPPMPVEATIQDPLEARLGMMEYNFHELYTRLARTEETVSGLTVKNQVLTDGLTRCQQWTCDLSNQLLAVVPDLDNAIHKDVASLRADITRHLDYLRIQEPIHGLSTRQQPYAASGAPFEPALPLSPRHQTFDTSRRPSLQVTSASGSFRAPLLPQITSPRRNGSLSVPDVPPSPSNRIPASYNTLPPPPIPQAQPQPPHPLATVQSPPSNLPRRHTSADIRLHGWQGHAPPPAPSNPQASSPYASGQNSSVWPSSPYHQPTNAADQQLRDSLAQYELPKASPHHFQSRQTTPPPDGGAPSYANATNDAGWQLPGPKFPFRGIEFSAPPTRRSSMASNVHSLLNPADTAEREGEDEPPEERKRKRI